MESIQQPLTGAAGAPGVAGTAGPASSVAGIAQGRQKVLSQLEREKAEREWERVRLNLKMAKKSKSGMRGALSNFVTGNLQLILGGAFDDFGGGTKNMVQPTATLAGSPGYVESDWTPPTYP